MGHGAATARFVNRTTATTTVWLRPLTERALPSARLIDIVDGAPVTDMYDVGPGADVLLELRLIRPAKARLAVTVRLPVSWGRPGGQVGPSVAFLLPAPVR
ncbi:hypothetical protein GCM10022243_01940 [Saccharothrix violaceirubra]|uniref:Uncharacterized protein n=1 Tax=Saccharothrix violaceirubra TaxID=413306 RepID=A0A7W7T4M7_9PSEU|nr:hypothetical protein [Saccharothrix violaceirubra]MBB4965952.1 hypothetical protein [Saccharothrix violaceirubra]